VTDQLLNICQIEERLSQGESGGKPTGYTAGKNTWQDKAT